MTEKKDLGWRITHPWQALRTDFKTGRVVPVKEMIGRRDWFRPLLSYWFYLGDNERETLLSQISAPSFPDALKLVRVQNPGKKIWRWGLAFPFPLPLTWHEVK